MRTVVKPMAAYVKREWRNSLIQCAAQGLSWLCKLSEELKREGILLKSGLIERQPTSFQVHRAAVSGEQSTVLLALSKHTLYFMNDTQNQIENPDNSTHISLLLGQTISISHDFDSIINNYDAVVDFCFFVNWLFNI